MAISNTRVGTIIMMRPALTPWPETSPTSSHEAPPASKTSKWMLITRAPPRLGGSRADAATRRTGNAKVYAGGDCINGGKEVVNAVADGREAARAMLRAWSNEGTTHG